MRQWVRRRAPIVGARCWQLNLVLAVGATALVPEVAAAGCTCTANLPRHVARPADVSSVKSGDSEFATVTWTGGDIPCLVTLEIEKVSGSYTLGQVVPSDSVGLWPLGPDADDPSEPLPWGSAQATVSYDVSADVIATTIFEMELVVRSDDTGSVMCRSGSGPGIGNGDLCVVPNEEVASFLGYSPSPNTWKHAPAFGGAFVDDDHVTPTTADFDRSPTRQMPTSPSQLPSMRPVRLGRWRRQCGRRLRRIHGADMVVDDEGVLFGGHALAHGDVAPAARA